MLSKHTRELTAVPFVASYAGIAFVAALSLVVAALLKLPEESVGGKQSAEQGAMDTNSDTNADKNADANVNANASSARPMHEIARNPVFIVAVMSSAIGYGVMNLLMVATPLAMGFCGYPFAASADVIMWHVIAMFAPSFVTGRIIERIGVLTVTLLGAGCMAICVAIALSGQAVLHFQLALILIGLGWNFMYVGGSTLLTQTYRPSEKAKVQGTHDLLVFCTTATTSFASGVLVKTQGWTLLNQVSLLPIAIAVIGMAWLVSQRGFAVKPLAPQ
jgi:MFS family permease